MASRTKGFLALLPVLALAPAGAQMHDHSHHQQQPLKIVQEGLAVQLEVEPLSGGATPVEGEAARVRFTITDTLTGVPMSRVYPGAWFDRMGDGVEDGVECNKKIQSFLGGSLLSRPELDLNTYYVITLNADATISVVDPLFGYGNSKLLAMVFLDSPGEDWVLSEDGNRLFVSMPASNKVAVVDTAEWKVAGQIETGPNPRRLGLQPDGQYLWAAHDSGVTVIDARAAKNVSDLATGAGSHDLAFSDDSRFAFVTNEAGGTVSVIETGRLAKLRDVKAGRRPVSLAWSNQAKAAYVVSAGDGTVAVVDGLAAEPRALIRSTPGLGRIRFAPGGRLAFVVHPSENTVHILDAVSDRIIQTADTEAEPDQVAFSDELAYIRHRGSELVLMVPLKTVGQPGRPVPIVDFPGGQRAPGKLPRPTPADGMVPAPGHPSILVVNAEDKAVYFYKEGMAAPMGHFVTYGKVPIAVRVVDRSLREVRPGVYETVARMGTAGDYELAMLLDSPRVVHCFPLKVAANPVLAAARKLPLHIEVSTGKQVVAVGEDVAIQLRLADPDSLQPRTGVRDVQALTFLSPGIWQQHHQARELGGGLYEIRFRPPEAGVYFVFVEVASAKMPFQKSPFLTLEAEGARP
ncbi:MAG TPA: cytochrome D1 [Thermoanaerobaculia bacterium]